MEELPVAWVGSEGVKIRSEAPEHDEEPISLFVGRIEPLERLVNAFQTCVNEADAGRGRVAFASPSLQPLKGLERLARLPHQSLHFRPIVPGRGHHPERTGLLA